MHIGSRGYDALLSIVEARSPAMGKPLLQEELSQGFGWACQVEHGVHLAVAEDRDISVPTG